MRRTGTWLAAFVLLGGAALGPVADAVAAGSSPTDNSPPPSASPTPGAPGTQGAATDKATFGLGPATKNVIDRRNNFGYLQAQGSVVTDQVAVVNLGTKPLTLNIYAADAVNDVDGSLGLQPGRVKPTGSASWVTVATPNGKGYVVVPARTVKGPTTVIVPFTVRIPRNAEVGDHLAGIVASLVTEGQAPGNLSANVKFEQRIAVRLATRVAGVLKAQLEVDDLSASYLGTLNPVGRGTTTVTYTVRNTGNVRLGGKPSINVHGLFGPGFSPSEVPDIPLLLPGYSATVTVEVPDVIPLISMSADVSVVALAAVGDANPASDTSTATAHFWAVPWTLLALLLTLILAVAWWLRRRRNTPGDPGRRSDESTFAGGPTPVGLVPAGSSTSSSELPS